jgi:integrase
VRFYDGNKKQTYLSGFATKEDAQAAAIEYKRNQMHEVDRNITLAEFLNIFLEDYCPTQLNERTAIRYKELLTLHVMPSIGDLTLAKIKPAHLQKFYKDFACKKKSVWKKSKNKWVLEETKQLYSSTTILHTHRLLHKALEYACEQGYIQHNPAGHVTAPKKAHTNIIIPADSEITQIYNMSRNTPYFLPIYISSTTGMRLGEVCGLQQEDVDTKNCRYYVRHSYQRVGNRMVLGTPKTSGSERNIPFLEGTLGVLRAYENKINQIKRLAPSAWYLSNHYIRNLDGTPVRPEAVSKYFRRLCKSLKINRVTFHSLRHYHATWMLRQGVHTKVVSERLGHAKIQITLDTYTHLVPGIQEKAIHGLDTKIFELEK